MTSVAVIGGGKIGEALISGLVKGAVEPEDINVTNRHEERGEYLKAEYGVVPLVDNPTAVEGVDVVFLCVKPQYIAGVIEEISESLSDNDNTIVVSMAAGITLATMEELLPVGSAVARVMPNTPMLIGKGMCAIAPGRFVEEDQLDEVVQLLKSVGSVLVVNESEMDAVTAMSGSSPAYLFLITEAMIDAGVSLGLSRQAAQELSVNAFYGAACMMKETGEEPSQLRANVSSPAGTTVAALRSLEESGIRGAFYKATEACADRSAELGKN